MGQRYFLFYLLGDLRLDGCEDLILSGPEERLPVPHSKTKRWTSFWLVGSSLWHSWKVTVSIYQVDYM